MIDGSRVELNTATVIRSAMTGQRREIWLDRGEAFFDVAHHDGLPFVVHAGNRRITVLGTKFSVRRESDKVIVSVLRGRVRVDDADNPKSVRSAIITAGDMAIARGPSTLLALRAEEKVESALAWRDGMLNFDDMRLGDAASEFNRYHNRKLLVDDPSVADMRIDGAFQASNIDAFVRLLHDAYGLKVEQSAQGVRISAR
jgi:transmembrane sensor